MPSSASATLQELKTPPRRANDRGHDPRSRPLSDSQNTCRCGCGTVIPALTKTGSPMEFAHGHNRRRPLEERFWEKVQRGSPDECWPWKASKSALGYGWFKGQNEGEALAPHRVAYEFLVGPIPAGLELDHLCRNPSCVNPNHLEPVTHAENMARSAKARQTHCIHGHEFTPENTYRNANGTRACRACNRERARKTRKA